MNIKRFIENKFVNKILERMPIIDKLLDAEGILCRVPLNKKLLERIIQNDEIFSNFLMDERCINKILTDSRLRNKIQIANMVERSSRFKYEPPSFLISFPRSGSNFIQNVLQISSGFCCQSIYGSFVEPVNLTLSLKSHAISLDYFFDELRRLVPQIQYPSKFILLKRDPRDVMISFYEFVKVQRDVNISQDDFINNICFFYATRMDKEFKRRVEKSPMSIRDAYKKHIEEWFVKHIGKLDCIAVKYEDLVNSPEAEFQRIFNFLELDCPLVKGSLKTKVSLYKDDQNKYQDNRINRAQPFCWRNHKKEYDILLGHIQRNFEKEIYDLGYEN